ncbi:MAG TPA: FAD-dependent oxidoreductase, partial [Steroidobacteraceae bacterium]|nr:FAD-dependent oxidoreductase [Steroidobacteraceae bacterium]
TNYPLLTQLLSHLCVPSQPTCMSFSVHNEASGLEYNSATLNAMFCQRRNLCSPRFIGMIRDLLRFYREAPALLRAEHANPTLEEYLAENRYGAAFRDEHLIPMAAALWSAPTSQVLSFPARYLVQFMANHQMLQVNHRPQWRVIRGGSNHYIQALRRRWSVRERLNCPALAIRRDATGVQVTSRLGNERFDQAVLACHSDQALALLRDASDRERDVLGAIPYRANDTVLHTDARVMPRHRRAWAAWNVWLPREPGVTCTVSYWMNRLQSIASPTPFIVTLNRTRSIDPEKILARMTYTHPVYSHASVAAQARKAEIQGQRRTWFAGAYWGLGFHEDGIRSAAQVAAALGVRWPIPAAGPVPEASTPPLMPAPVGSAVSVDGGVAA